MKAHLGVDVNDDSDGGSGSGGGGGRNGGDGSTSSSNNQHNHSHKNNSHKNSSHIPDDCVFARLLNKLHNEGIRPSYVYSMSIDALTYATMALPPQITPFHDTL